jgi:hypothetical protein
MREPNWIRTLTTRLGTEVEIPRTLAGLHLGIFVEPYLTLVLEGRKTIESRFGVQRCAPHGRVSAGDLLLLKASGGPVVGICRIEETWFFDLRVTTLSSLRDRFARPLCAEDGAFWQARSHATLATLMRLKNVRPLSPIPVEKRDRRGWVTLRDASALELGFA